MAKKNKRDLVIVTIKSDEIDQNTLDAVRKQFKKALKSKSKKRIAIFGIGPHDSIEVNNCRESTMNAVIRLDDKGSPYLIVNYEDREGNEQSASDDAERLFFTHLNQNGGLLHLVPGKARQMRMLVTTGTVKRKASVTESRILGSPKSRDQQELNDLIDKKLDAKIDKLINDLPDEIKEPTQSADLTNDSVIPSSTVVDPDEGGDAFPR